MDYISRLKPGFKENFSDLILMLISIAIFGFIVFTKRPVYFDNNYPALNEDYETLYGGIYYSSKKIGYFNYSIENRDLNYIINMVIGFKFKHDNKLITPSFTVNIVTNANMELETFNIKSKIFNESFLINGTAENNKLTIKSIGEQFTLNLESRKIDTPLKYKYLLSVLKENKKAVVKNLSLLKLSEDYITYTLLGKIKENNKYYYKISGRSKSYTNTITLDEAGQLTQIAMPYNIKIKFEDSEIKALRFRKKKYYDINNSSISLLKNFTLIKTISKFILNLPLNSKN